MASARRIRITADDGVSKGKTSAKLRDASLAGTRTKNQASKRLLPLQPGDVPDTCADVEELMNDTGYSPSTPIEAGVARFVEWYRGYYGA